MAYQIRLATQADQPAITAMVRAAGINPLSLHWPRFRVAEDAGRVVGVAQIKIHSDASRELASLAVAPDRQGQGIGGVLIRHLLTQPEGQPPLFLMCRNELEGYYARFGFHRVERGKMPPYFRRMTRVAVVFIAISALFGEQRHVIVMRHDGAAPTA
jgi:N-acetylglutamate synthase-like GNAT family acetyltransferase